MMAAKQVQSTFQYPSQISSQPKQRDLGLAKWSVIINEGLRSPRHFDIIIMEFLGYALRGKVSKIMLGVPSRHGKSTLISKNFASYFLAHYPNDQVILSSYSQALASEFGGEVKDIINTYGYLSRKNPVVRPDSKAKNKFKLFNPDPNGKKYHGQMLSVGSMGSILGFGAGLFIIDDPIKNIADAESSILQAKLRDWFESTAKSRLQKRTNKLPPIMLVIAQRLHLKDLHGIIKDLEPVISAKEALSILRNGGTIDPNTWVDLNFPAICEDPTIDLLGRKQGEVLWEEQRSYDWLMAEKKAMGSYLFNSIYQGNPIERDGNIFKREWFQDITTNKITCLVKPSDVPTNTRRIRYWDFAASGDEGDATAGLLTTWDGNTLYFLDLKYGHYTTSQLLKTYKKITLIDGKMIRSLIEQEPGSASKVLIETFRKDSDFKKEKIKIKADKVKYAKNIRSFQLEALCEDRQVKMVPAWWNTLLIDQLVSFTGQEGKPDDITDVCTGSARYWTRPRRGVLV